VLTGAASRRFACQHECHINLCTLPSIVCRRVALNELAVQERLCGALPQEKWDVSEHISRLLLRH
jgi:hypothetical protein